MTTAILAGAAALSMVFELLTPNSIGNAITSQGGSLGVVEIMAIAAILVNTVAWIIGFFAQMYYVRWLAPRIPSERVYKRAKLLTWLGPVIHIFGMLCMGIGPLIALVLYWNMLEWVRKDIKALRARLNAAQAPA